MANCTQCGKSLSLLSFAKMCQECKDEIEEKEARQREKRELQQRKQAQLEKQNRISQKINDLKKKLNKGESVFLYDTIYLPVDSIILDELIHDVFSIAELRELGIEGWEVVQIIPRTMGTGLTNEGAGFNKSWGGGTGGNVIGVHAILKKEVISIDETNPDESLVRFINRYF